MVSRPGRPSTRPVYDPVRDAIVLHFDDDAAMQHDGPCWRLADPLFTGPLPDHLCPEGMQATVAAWVAHASQPFTLLHRMHQVQPAGQPLPWPLPTPQGHLALVIQQWVEGPPSREYAADLAADARWRGAIRTIRMRLLSGAFRIGDVPEDLLDRRVIVHGSPSARRRIGEVLRDAGIPATPGTVEHAVAAVAGASSPLPTEGVLVATLVFLRRASYPQESWEVDPSPVTIMLGETALMSGSLVSQARRIVQQHRAWIQEQVVASRMLVDLHVVAPVLPTTVHRICRRHGAHIDASDAYFDYVAEALRDTDTLAENVRTDPSREPLHIRHHLDVIYYRVSKRRRYNHLPVNPGPNWRETATRMLLDQLHISGAESIASELRNV